MKCLLLAVTITGLAILPSWSMEKDARLDKLVTAIQQVLDQNKESRPSDPGTNPDSERMMFLRLRNAITTNDTTQIEEALQGLAITLDSAQLRKECEDLSGQLRIEREAKEKRAVDQINAALKHTEQVVHTAKKASDFDDLFSELANASSQGAAQPLSHAESAALNKIEPYTQFITSWQEYLADTEIGNIEGARQALQNLTGGSTNLPYLIPRSEILARLQFMIQPPAQQPNQDNDQGNSSAGVSNEPTIPTVEKPLWFDKSKRIIGFHVENLDQLDGVINALGDLKARSEFKGYSASIDDLLKTLLPLDAAYKGFKAGLAVDIEIPSGNLDTSNLENELIPLRAELITLALPRYLGLPPESKAKPGEGAYDFLERIEAEAIANSDFLLAAQVRDTEHLLVEGKQFDPNARFTPQPYMAVVNQQAATSDEKAQARLFVTAHNQDEAGQYALAVASYERALASGTDLVPPSLIGKQLAAIKSQHPDDFQHGLDLFFQMPTNNRFFGYPPGFPTQRRGMQPVPTPAPALSVPVASPIPKSSASPAKK